MVALLGRSTLLFKELIMLPNMNSALVIVMLPELDMWSQSLHRDKGLMLKNKTMEERLMISKSHNYSKILTWYVV